MAQEHGETGARGTATSARGTPRPGRARPRRRSPAAQAPAAHLPVAQVLVDVPLAHLDRPFDYLVPEKLAESAVPGCRVRVRFAGQLVSGYLLGRASAAICGVSTGSGETTRSRAARRPWCSLTAARPSR